MEDSRELKAVVMIPWPDGCEHCDLRITYFDDEGAHHLCGRFGTNAPEVNFNKKPDWCPAVPVPVKLPENRAVDDERRALWHGWNSCIDAISGEEE